MRNIFLFVHFLMSQNKKFMRSKKGVCVARKEKFEIDEMEADHITPWHDGGKTLEKNCQMLCKECNRTKSGK